MTTMAARAQRRGVAVLAEPIVTRVLPSRRSSGRQCARVNHAAITVTTASHNPWLPIRRNASARVGCTDEDPDVFFGPVDSSESEKSLIWEKKALAICAECIIQLKCLAEALQHPAAQQYGVVGGMTASQRRALLRGSHRTTARSPESNAQGDTLTDGDR